MTRGVALPVVLLILVVVLGLVAGGFAMTLADYRIGQAMVEAVRASGMAEWNAWHGLARWPQPDLRSLPVGGTLVANGGAIRVTRTGAVHYFFEGTAIAGSGSVQRRVGVIATPTPATVVANRALSVGGAVRAALGSVILDSPPGRLLRCDGADSVAAGWIGGSWSTGTPESRSVWGRRATVRLPGGAMTTPNPTASRGACVVTDANNWGDPTGGWGPCAGHRPVVYVAGSLTVFGGVGQGVLVVDGDLDVAGGLVFDGLVLVGGRLRITGSGGTFRGAVQVEDLAGRGSDLGSNARITYSTCSLDEAARWIGPMRPIGRGAWFGEY